MICSREWAKANLVLLAPLYSLGSMRPQAAQAHVTKLKLLAVCETGRDPSTKSGIRFHGGR